MRRKVVIAMLIAASGGSTAYADSGCGGSLMRELRASEHIVDSLRPDKPGQYRVYAIDGSEFTAGQSQWMHGRIHKIGRACVRGDTAKAARLLLKVQRLIQARARP
jgi:hypothetical protein